MTKWFVSRQIQWPDGDPVVEIAEGGRDYANPDMLVPKWGRLGEGDEFNNPKEAVSAAIAICRAWKEIEPRAEIAHGFTGGYTMPFEPSDYQELIEWANNEWESLPKCDWCGDVREEKETWQLTDDPDLGKYCSENCCDNAYQEWLKDQQENELDAEI